LDIHVGQDVYALVSRYPSNNGTRVTRRGGAIS
jgi:hypothetical protein